MYWPATSIAHLLALTEASNSSIACLRGLPLLERKTLSTSVRLKVKGEVIHVIKSLDLLATDNTTCSAFCKLKIGNVMLDILWLCTHTMWHAWLPQATRHMFSVRLSSFCPFRCPH